jgi:hypothetical protein
MAQFAKRGLLFEADKKKARSNRSEVAMATGLDSQVASSFNQPKPYMDTTAYGSANTGTADMADEVAQMGFSQPTGAMEAPEHPIRSALEVKYMELHVIDETPAVLPAPHDATVSTSLHASEAEVVVLHEPAASPTSEASGSAPATGRQNDGLMTTSPQPHDTILTEANAFTLHMTLMKTSRATGPGRYKLKISPELYEDLVCNKCSQCTIEHYWRLAAVDPEPYSCTWTITCLARD